MNPHQLMMLAVFSLIFVVSCVALKSAKLFGHPARIVISLCVAALCIISLFATIDFSRVPHSSSSEKMQLPQADSPPDHSLSKLILLPYLVLRISVPVVLLLILCAKLGLLKWFEERSRDDKRQMFNCSSNNRQTGTTVLKNGKIYEQ